MRSGWGDYWTNDIYIDKRNQLKTISDYMAFIKDIPLDFEPGTNFQHSNIGYEVAGAVIEAVSGMDYYDYINKNIYNVSGMTHTGSYFRNDLVENRATGYTNMGPDGHKDGATQLDNLNMLPPRGTPAGGGYSTIEDLLKFGTALRNYKVLGPGYTHFLINRFAGSIDGPFTPQEQMYHMVGAAPGISAFFGLDFQSSYTVIVLSNYDMPMAIEIADGITRMLGIE